MQCQEPALGRLSPLASTTGLGRLNKQSRLHPEGDPDDSGNVGFTIACAGLFIPSGHLTLAEPISALVNLSRKAADLPWCAPMFGLDPPQKLHSMAGMCVASCDITDLLMQQDADFELSVVVGQSFSSGCIHEPVQVRQLKLQKQVEGIQTMLGLILVAHCRSDLQFP